MKERELLVVSFGTTSPESRTLNIDSVEQTLRETVPDTYDVCRCFTSQMVINIVNKREGIRIDSVREAVDKAVQNMVRILAVQPTHLMKGIEYEKLCRILSEYADAFDKIVVGDPLLSSEEDFNRVADALIVASAEFDDGETAIVFMGHGTEAAANGIYERMQNVLESKGRSNYYIGTVEAEPSLESVIEAVNAGHFRRVILRPLMLVAGNHAINDMADADDPESWYSRFKAAGYETICIIEGLGQLHAVREIYADHAIKAISTLNECNS